ncbi:unnamed protein product (macronuclear) [Paramecium tetraurelia]|uniref:Phospholipid scramblase n=1 Tax=Paramecium tetraurelia TaxID=5888 RepID=A0E4R3_PARTE|nr:uncharacterized protein GSPATT00023455001 [Paramecium tetraurelia]CAK90280.1 unnamed protein product [Paramecium tetraurelia]|eukprot:XP_001457677.1 hypothetical protein (macronuclear) [Paramecium tetraurelia strain d4-2]
MYIRPPDSKQKLAQVGIADDDIEHVKSQHKVEQNLTVEDAINRIDEIPDEVTLIHDFKYKDTCLEKQEVSNFYLPQIGVLTLGGHIRRKCKDSICPKCDCQCLCFSCRCCGESDGSGSGGGGGGSCSDCTCAKCCKFLPCTCGLDKCCQCCNCISPYEANHYYMMPLYILKNDKIRFEHFNYYAKLYIYDTLVLEFMLSGRNYADLAFASCKSNFPHVCFTNPLNQKNEKIYFEPLGNKCPTNPRPCFYCCTLCSLAGICELERKIVATVGENAEARITARREKKYAWISQCGCQDRCYHFIDYPEFEMKFKNLTKIQKLGLIFSTISYTIFGRWEQFSFRGVFNFNKTYLDY